MFSIKSLRTQKYMILYGMSTLNCLKIYFLWEYRRKRKRLLIGELNLLGYEMTWVRNGWNKSYKLFPCFYREMSHVGTTQLRADLLDICFFKCIWTTWISVTRSTQVLKFPLDDSVEKSWRSKFRHFRSSFWHSWRLSKQYKKEIICVIQMLGNLFPWSKITWN